MKTKAHIQYKLLANGMRVPGVTTVLGILNKPALLYWAWDLGMKGEDYRKVRDKAADIGTIAHYLIECHLKGEEPELGDYSPNAIDKAENCLLAFLEWEKPLGLKLVASELPLVSEVHGFGGTLDIMASIKGQELCLLDIKSSKGIYDEMIYQVAAYKYLWEENNPEQPINQVSIIKLGKEDGSFEHRTLPNLETPWEIFKHCLGIYKLQKEKA